MIEGIAGFTGSFGQCEGLVPILPHRRVKVLEDFLEKSCPAHQCATEPHRLGFGGPLGGELLGAHGESSIFWKPDRVSVFVNFNSRTFPGRTPGVLGAIWIEGIVEGVPPDVVGAELADHFACKSSLGLAVFCEQPQAHGAERVEALAEKALGLVQEQNRWGPPPSALLRVWPGVPPDPGEILEARVVVKQPQVSV